LPNPKIFTAIIDTYYRPALLKEAVAAILRQTYSNLELILVNNGATPETVDYLYEIEAHDHRVKLVHFEENQFSWDDPQKLIDICLNAALKVATGEYVWYQGDDDLISDNYAEKMVSLFEGNSECITAAGLPIVIDIDGHIMDTKPRVSNIRPRYMPGNLLALDQLRGGNMFGAPGCIFTVRRDALVKAGGFNRALEPSYLYGIVPFGITGFDETAVLFARNHSGQLNKLLMAKGWMGIDENLSMVKDCSIEERWSVFGTGVARGVVRSFKRKLYNQAASGFVTHVYAFRPRAALPIIWRMWFRPYFWTRVFVNATDPKKIRNLIGPIIKPTLKRLFQTWPSLATLSPVLARLREKSEVWS